MRKYNDPLVISNLAYGIPAIISHYHNFYLLAFLQSSVCIGSSVYHLFDEHPKFKMIDYIPSLFMGLFIFIQWIKSYKYKIFYFVPFHVIWSIYLFNHGGWSPHCGGCKTKYRLYHTLWHLSGGAAFMISTWFRKLNQ